MARLLPTLMAVGLLAGCGSNADAPKGEAATTAEATTFQPLASIKNASVTLPEDPETFGEGPQADLLNRNCLACHSVSMVRYQPPLTAKQWTATVTKMREAYGGPIDEAETGAIVEALMAKAPGKP